MIPAHAIGVAHGTRKPAHDRQTAALVAFGVRPELVFRGSRGKLNLGRLLSKVARPGGVIVMLPGHTISRHYLAKMRANGALVMVAEPSWQPN